MLCKKVVRSAPRSMQHIQYSFLCLDKNSVSSLTFVLKTCRVMIFCMCHHFRDLAPAEALYLKAQDAMFVKQFDFCYE